MFDTIANALSRFWGDVPELRPLTLRFRDAELERVFQRAYFEANLGMIRVAHLFGIFGWIALGVLAQTILHGSDGAVDAGVRAVAVVMTVISLALTYRPSYAQRWRPLLSFVILASGLMWCFQQAVVDDGRADWGYAGLMVVLAFCFILSRLQTVDAVAVGVAIIAAYNVSAIAWGNDPAIDLVFGDYFLIVFALVGAAAAYGLERSGRVLFLREQQLDLERRRADDLLRNTLPESIVGRLKGRDPSVDHGYLADGHPQVTVLFADLVGFTQRSSGIPPQEVVAVLDGIFSDFDALADRLGLEKIKTVGDAYMAVAGVPDEQPDDADAAAEMALRVVEVLRSRTWPNGDPIEVRVGMATGPAVAGVIGKRRFAYDLWGDTVNLASRLESSGEPGGILVSESTFELLRDRYAFGDPRVIDLKGKGPTPARLLLGRRAPVAEDPAARAREPVR